MLRKARRARVLDESAADAFVAHALDVAQEFVERPELGEQLRRRLLAHRRHAGHVVRRVADESEEVDDLLGKDAVLGEDAVSIEPLVCVAGAATAWAKERDPVADDLGHVLVGGRDETEEAVFSAAKGKRREHVVAFDARLREHRNPEDTEQLDHERQLLRQFRGHRLPRRLVVSVQLVSERHPAHVEDGGHVGRGVVA